MFEYGGEAAEAAVTSRNRTILVSVLVDWNLDGEFDHELSDLSHWVVDATTDRSLRGSAPDEVLFVSGASAAELRLSLTGEFNDMSLTAIFSPYNGFSPFYLQDVVGPEIVYRLGIETATGTVWYPQFRGNITELSPNRGENTVSLTALDRVEKLRRPVQLPPWAMSEEHVAFGEMESQLVRSHWVIDHCLRLCDVGQSPLRPSGSFLIGDTEPVTQQFFMSGNGSYLPTVGYVDNPNASSFPAPPTELTVREGPTHPELPPGIVKPWALNGLGTPIGQANGDASQQGIIRYWSAARTKIDAYGGHYCGFTLNLYDDAYETIGQHNALEIRIGDFYEIRVTILNGLIRSALHHMEPGSTVSNPVTDWLTLPDEPHVNVHVYWYLGDTGRYGYIRLNDDFGDPVQLLDTAGPLVGPDQITGRITVGHALSMSDVYYATSSYVDIFGYPMTAAGKRPTRYPAVLDQGLNRFTHMPSSEVQEAWDIITEVADAENGSVFWSEEGVFHFWNLLQVLDKQNNPVRTLTLDDITGLSITNSWDNVRNVYSVQARRKRALFEQGIYSLSDANEMFCGQAVVKQFRLWRTDVLSPLTFFMERHSTLPGSSFPAWTDDVGHGFVVQYLIGGVWQEDDSKPSPAVSVFFDENGYLIVEVLNPWSTPDLRLATGDRGALRFAGTKINDYDTVPIVTRGNTTWFGERVLELSGDWHQDSFVEGMLQDLLLERTSRPAPVTDAITIAGDPRLQLGDTVTVQDPDGFGEQFHLQIYGINRQFSRDGGLTDTLTVEMIRPPGIGIWDSLQYGRWDETFVWSE